VFDSYQGYLLMKLMDCSGRDQAESDLLDKMKLSGGVLMCDILCIGHASYDVVLPLPGYPEENRKYALNQKVESGGGPASNAAVLLSKWGVRTAFMGQVGDDVYGRTVVLEIEASGVDVSLLHISPDLPTPHSTILVNLTNGSRTILNVRQTPRPMPFSRQRLISMNPRILLLDGHEADVSLQALALFPGALSILDAGSVKPGTLKLAERVDYLIPSESFALSYSDLSSLDDSASAALCLKKLSQLTRGKVIVTLGEQGLIHWSEDRVHYLPAFPVKAVDTTGAGDVFHGAFAYGLLQGYSLEQNLRFSSAASAISVQTLGSRSSIPGLNEVMRLSSTPGTHHHFP